MYTDLRQYILTQKCKVEKYTYGWYVKQFCEYCKNPIYVDGLMSDLERILNEDFDLDYINLFVDLIGDYHISDAFDSGMNIMLEIILSCFLDDFILETDDIGYFHQFMEYSKTAQLAIGKKPDLLAEWLEDHFHDFAYMEDVDGGVLTVEKLTEQMRLGLSELEELNEEINMSSAILVIDENTENIDKLKFLLDLLDFTEVIPGMYYTGIVYFESYMGDAYGLDNDNLMDVIELFSDLKKQRELDDDIFCAINGDVSNGRIERLAQSIKFCSSHREVIF